MISIARTEENLGHEKYKHNISLGVLGFHEGSITIALYKAGNWFYSKAMILQKITLMGNSKIQWKSITY